MKRFLLLVLTLFCLGATHTLKAQQVPSPRKFTYQAIVRDAQNNLMRDSVVAVRISIYKDAANGTLVYQDQHHPKTNTNGLFSVVIGEGQNRTGVFADIDWSTGVYYLRSEIDPHNGTTYPLSAVQQLISVPFALHCEEHQNLADVVENSNSAGMSQLKDVEDPTDSLDAVTKGYLDSIYELMFALVDDYRRDTVASECENFTWYGNTLTHTGIYIHRLEGAANQGASDSVVMLRLTIDAGGHNVYRDTACSGPYTWPANGTHGHGTGETYSASGTYHSSYTTLEGCPGADTLKLVYGTPSNGTDTRTECSELTWIDGNTYTASNTTATHTLHHANASGCDSTVTLHLTILGNASGTKSVTACEDYTWSSSDGGDGLKYSDVAGTGITLYNAANKPTHTLIQASSHGCDSVVTLNLTLNHAVDVTDERNICQGGAISWYGNSYNTAVLDGSVRHQFLDHAHGDCPADSILALTVNTPPSVTLGDITSSAGTAFCTGTSTNLASSLTASSGTVTYAWTVSPTANAGLSAANAVSTSANPTNTGSADATYTYTLTATAKAAGCSDATDSKNISITVHPGALTPVVEGDKQMCPQGSTTVNISAATYNSAATYTWYQGASDVQTSSSQNFVADALGSYSVDATLGECTSSKTNFTITQRTITINPTVSASSTSFKVGNTTNLSVSSLNASISGGTPTYSWSCTSSNSSTAGLTNTTSATASAKPTAQGTYTFQVVVNYSYQGCSASSTKTVSVTVTPACTDPSISTIKWDRVGSGYTNIPCVLKSTVSASNYTSIEYEWIRYTSNSYAVVSSSNGAIGSNKGADLQNFYIVPPSTGTLYYQLKVTAKNGDCQTVKTYNSNISVSSLLTSTTSRTSSVSKSGSTITVTGTAGNKSHYMCASATISAGKTAAFTPTTSTILAKSSGTTSTSKSITISLGSTPPSGTSVRVYVWFSSSSGCTSNIQSKITNTTLSY